MTSDWKILRGEKQCASCEKKFEENECYWSALYDRTTEFERLDYCADCWKEDTAGMFSFWQTRVPQKTAKKKLLVDDEVLVDFFHRTEGASDDLKMNFRYIIALVLMRKKRLKFVDVKRTDDGEFLVLKERETNAEHQVRNPNLDEVKILQLTEEVGKILNVEL